MAVDIAFAIGKKGCKLLRKLLFTGQIEETVSEGREAAVQTECTGPPALFCGPVGAIPMARAYWTESNARDLRWHLNPE